MGWARFVEEIKTYEHVIGNQLQQVSLQMMNHGQGDRDGRLGPRIRFPQTERVRETFFDKAPQHSRGQMQSLWESRLELPGELEEAKERLSHSPCAQIRKIELK